MLSDRPWDVHSASLSWVLAAIGVVLTAVAADACHSSANSATVSIVIALLTTVQLLGFTAMCWAYRTWVVNTIDATQLGPGRQDEPDSRRGLPALRSSRGFAGLDGWSVLVISLVIAPVLVPLSTYYKPKQHFQWANVKQQPLGATFSDDYNNNGATWYTVGALESITMSMQATITQSGSITMSNTADIIVDDQRRRTYLPSRVPAACKHERVEAKNLKALVGEFSCNTTKGVYTIDPCSSSMEADFICVKLKNSTVPLRPPVQYLRVTHQDMLVQCKVTYSVTTLDVTWQGITTALDRRCRIAKWGVHDDVPEDKTVDLSDQQDLTGNTSLLELPLINAFQWVVSHARVWSSTDQGIELFYGSIFAAATTVRSVSKLFDPTIGTLASGEQWFRPGVVPVRYSSRTCQRYGWSGMTSVLLVANIILALCCTFLCSGLEATKLWGYCATCCRSPRLKQTAKQTTAARLDSVITTATGMQGQSGSEAANWRQGQPRIPVGMGQQGHPMPSDNSGSHQSAGHTLAPTNGVFGQHLP